MEKLETIVMADEVWSAITLEMIASETDMREQIQDSGQCIIGHVITGRFSVDDLRHLARWTNMLSHEATKMAKQADSLGNEVGLEVTARQILHGSVSAALKEVRTDGRLVTHRVRRAKRHFAEQA